MCIPICVLVELCVYTTQVQQPRLQLAFLPLDFMLLLTLLAILDRYSVVCERFEDVAEMVEYLHKHKYQLLRYDCPLPLFISSFTIVRRHRFSPSARESLFLERKCSLLTRVESLRCVHLSGGLCTSCLSVRGDLPREGCGRRVLAFRYPFI